MRKRHGFTLIELMIVLIVLAILAAIAIPIYRNQVEKTRADVSAANLEAIWEAWKITCMKNDVSPTEMSKLWNKNHEYFLAGIFSLNAVYAEPPGVTSNEPDWVPPGHRRDPSDNEDGRADAVFSYGINRNAVEEPEEPGRGRRWRDVQDDERLHRAINPVPIIAEYNCTDTDTAFSCDLDLPDYSAIARRHRKGSAMFGLFINFDGTVYAVEGERPPVPYKNYR